MSRIPPPMWDDRLAVPLAGTGWTASIDDVRSLVDAVHTRIDAVHPQDDYFLNLLATGVLAGRRPKHLAHLKKPVVILGSYNMRRQHVVEALEDIEKNGEGVLKALAAAAGVIEQRGVRNCVDVLVPEVRGGPWCWGDAARPEDQDALAQEHRAWVHLGATPRDINQEDHTATLTDSLKRIAHLEAKHGGADPASWRWGEGTPCADVFAADDAKREHEGLKAKVSALQQLSNAASGSGATRERSRSPRFAPTRSDA